MRDILETVYTGLVHHTGFVTEGDKCFVHP